MIAIYPILLIDIGSTYTKVIAVDLDAPAVLGTGAAHTTIQTDVTAGLTEALAALERQTGTLLFRARFACSSAAGGLAMVASGLVPALTEKAARMACLGAGAKIIRSFSYGLTEEDIAEIDSLAPDIFLLVGGVDGGNEKVILHNAEMLSAAKTDFPIVLAGNRNAAAQCEALLRGRAIYRMENVMPRLDVLNLEPIQAQIRALFLEHIIHAKGLSRVAVGLSSPIIPTPAAMLEAMELLSSGTGGAAGIGQLVAVDLGGATTDVYSIATGAPTGVSTIVKGLPEPFAKRTVEGDMGMRYSVHGILEAVGTEAVAAMSGLDTETVQQLADCLFQNPNTLPDTPALKVLDRALASAAIATAVARHAGTIEEVYTPLGQTFLQVGKDLTEVGTLIVTGGAIIHSPDAEEIARHALFDARSPTSLRPKGTDIYVDRHYILASMGLLAKAYPREALVLMKQALGTTHVRADGNPPVV
ncbi:MAG: methylaspartate mutase accessory protein GlmL [Oscillospiraceae bacterium]|nr:methylaspartate mutase accessory protein GlmL [Oscillospiraceae bacterium]